MTPASAPVDASARESHPMTPSRITLSLSALLLAAAVLRAAEPVEPAASVPGSFDVYLQIDDAAGLRKGFVGSEFWKRLQKTAFWAEVADSPDLRGFDKLRSEWAVLFGRRLHESFDALVGVRAAVAFRSDGKDGGDGILVGRAASAEALRDFLNRFADRQKADGRDVRLIDSDGRLLMRFDGHFVAAAGDVWVVAEKEELISESLDLATGKAKGSLADRPEYKAALAGLPAGRTAHFYIDIKQILGKQASDTADQRKAMEVMGSVRSLILGVYADAGALRIDGRLSADVGGFHPLVTALMGAGPAPADLAKIVPADAIAVTSLRLDVAAFRKGIEEIDPKLKSDDRFQVTAETMIKLYFDKLGPDYGLVIRPGSAGSGPLPVRIPGVAAAVRLKDPDVVRTLRDNLLWAMVGLKSAARREGADLTVTDTVYKGTTITVLDVDAALKVKGAGWATGSVRPAMAKVGDFLAIAAHEATVKAMLDVVDGTTPSLAAADDFRRTIPALAESNSGWGFVSFGRLADLLSDNRTALLLAGAGSGGPAGGPDASKRFDMALELIRLFDTAGTVRVNAADHSRIAVRIGVKQ